MGAYLKLCGNTGVTEAHGGKLEGQGCTGMNWHTEAQEACRHWHKRHEDIGVHLGQKYLLTQVGGKHGGGILCLENTEKEVIEELGTWDAGERLQTRGLG